MSIILKKVEEADAEILLIWRNMPSLIVLGESARKVTIEEHIAWMNKILLDEKGHYFIIIRDDVKCGHVRLEFIELQKYIISIYLLEHFRGKGVGTSVLELLFSNVICYNDLIIAKILLENVNSQLFFEKNGFKIIRKGLKLVTYARRKING